MLIHESHYVLYLFQDIVAINRAVTENTLHTRPKLIEAFDSAKKNGGRLHFLGLVSDGGVHSHITHLEALLRAAKDAGVPQSFVHFFGDGRDTAPTSGGLYACNQAIQSVIVNTVLVFKG